MAARPNRCNRLVFLSFVTRFVVPVKWKGRRCPGGAGTIIGHIPQHW